MLFKDLEGFCDISFVLDGLVLNWEADSEGEIDGDLVALLGGGEKPRWVGDSGTSSIVESGRGGYWVRLVFCVPRDLADWGWEAWERGDQGRSVAVPPVRVGERAREAAFGERTYPDIDKLCL